MGNDLALSNPYDYTRPVTKDRFYGRQGELTKLTSAILAGKSVVVYGLQRVGKTSLVEEALELAKNQIAKRFVVLPIDMFISYANLNSYFDLFVTILDALWEGVEGTAYGAYKDAQRQYFKRHSDLAELQRGFIALLAQAKKRLLNKQLLLFLDEFQDIAKCFDTARKIKGLPNPVDSGLVRYLGSLVKKGLLQLVICGRYQIIHLDRELNFQLLKTMTEIELGTLDDESARRAIQDPMRGTLEYETSAVQKLVLLTGGNPYLINYICSELVEEAKMHGTSRITEKHVEELVSRMTFGMTREPHFRVMYEDFEHIEDGMPWKVLLSIAHKAERFREAIDWAAIVQACNEELSLKVSSQRLHQAITVLRTSQIVIERRQGKKLKYLIAPDILRQWLQSQSLFYKQA